MAAIWKDYYVTLNNMTAADYRIRLDDASGSVIYTGRAVAKPGGTSISIRINDICADLLRPTALNFDLRFTAGLLTRTYFVQYKAVTATTWTDYGAVTFTNDWSYDYSYDADRDGYTFPISLVADPRQILMQTVPAGTVSVQATLTNADGTVTNVTIPVRRTADFNNDYNNDYSHVSDAAQAGVVMLNLGSYPSVVQAVFGGHTWRVDRGRCREYGVYYVNAYGGWDSLALYGEEVDAYKRHVYSVDYDNTKQSAQGAKDYLNEVDLRFALKTGMLTELGASRMHHLVGTNTAVIHEFSTGRILPVTVATDSVRAKTYRSEGRTPIVYDLEVSVAQDRQRR